MNVRRNHIHSNLLLNTELNVTSIVHASQDVTHTLLRVLLDNIRRKTGVIVMMDDDIAAWIWRWAAMLRNWA